jgi:hypothetical protein
MRATRLSKVLRRRFVALAVLPVLGLCGCREAGAAVYVGVSAVAANLETRYAPDFSEEKFREVAVGQSQEDVRTRLGEPLRKWTHDAIHYWAYSESPSSDDYWVRLVIFDSTGRVSETRAELYVD